MSSQMRIGTIYIGKTLDEVTTNLTSNAFNREKKKFSTYTCENSLQYAESPSRDNEFNLDNDDIQAKYVPLVNFTFNAITEEIYRDFIQIINSKGFYIKYYDYELGVDVIRKVYTSEQSVERLQFNPPKGDNTLGGISRLIGLQLTFVSKYAYESYQDLLDKASYDPKFYYEEVTQVQEDVGVYRKGYDSETDIFGSRYIYDTTTKKFKLQDTFLASEMPKNYDKIVWYTLQQKLASDESDTLFSISDKVFSFTSAGELNTINATRSTIVARDTQSTT